MEETGSNPTRVLIVGGGVAGVKCARELAKKELPNVRIELVSDADHFEYHGALYRLVAGSSPGEVCIPLREAFAGLDVSVVRDKIVDVDVAAHVALGDSGSRYRYDYLVLAVGSQTSYFGIEGLSDYAFEPKTVKGALTLKNHINTSISHACKQEDDAAKLRAGHVVIVGAGPTGVELAGELAGYARSLCGHYGMDPGYITVELVEAAPQVLPRLPGRFALAIEKRLRELRVNVLTNRVVERLEKGSVHLRGMHIDSETVVWTAGVQANELYRNIDGLETNKKGAVAVDDRLRAEGCENIFIAGDGAATKYAGMAQTALQDGAFIAGVIRDLVNERTPGRYDPRAPVSVIPVGPSWAGTFFGSLFIFGRLGWWVRRLADLKLYLSLLDVEKAFAAFWSGRMQKEAFNATDSAHPAE